MVSSKKLKTFFTKNISFTPQERTVLLFLCAAFLVGLAINLYYGSKTEKNLRKPYDYSSLDREFIAKSSSSYIAAIYDSTKLHPVNSITEEQLMSLPGIGQVLAGRIIEFRRKHGPLGSVEDLLSVPGIGQKRMLDIKQYLENKEKK